MIAKRLAASTTAGGALRCGLGWLGEAQFWAVLLAGLALWMLAYQWPYTHRLDLGGDRAGHRRDDDRPYLEKDGRPYHDGDSFHAPEPASLPGQEWWQQPSEPYRWATPDATVQLPGIGGGRWLISVRATGPPAPQPTISHWMDGTHTIQVALHANGPRLYRFLAQTQGGDLALWFVTPPFFAPGDPRALGFVAHRLVVAPLGSGYAPALMQLGLLAGTVGLLYGLARRLGAQSAWAGAGCLGLVASLGLMLAGWRLWLTIFSPALLAIAAGCYGLALALLALRPVGSQPAILAPGAVVLVILAFGLRLGGLLYPHTIFSDIGLNANNVIALTTGSVYFSEGLPSDAGGGQAPYPPGQYLLLAPGQLLLPADDAARKLLVKLGGALLDSMVVAGLWYTLWRSGLTGRAALFGAALYLAPTPVLNSFSVGEFANIIGQGLALPILGMLALAADQLRERRVLLVTLALLGIALLGHLGVTISLALLLLCLAMFWLLSPPARPQLGRLVLLGAVAGSLIGLFYYSAFAGLLGERATGVAASANVGQKLARVLIDIQAIGPLLLALGAAGGVLVGLRSAWPFRLLLAAWWAGGLLSLGLLLFASQGVRWALFLSPALCLGAGPLLAKLYQQGRAGRLVAILTLVALFARGIALWMVQLSHYLH